MTADLPLMKNVFTLLATSVLVPLGLTAATDTLFNTLFKKTLWVGDDLIISNKEIGDIMKVVKSLEKSCLFIKSVKLNN